MNWKEIKEKYPKAFQRLHEWYCEGLLEFHKIENRFGHYFTDGVHDILMFNDFEVRDLYDFFDSQGVKCFLNYDGTINISFDNNLYYLDDSNNWILYYIDRGTIEKEISDRSEAELSLFEKAFEILENKLNNNE